MQSNILQTIIAHKKEEIALQQQKVPITQLKTSPFFNSPIYSLKKQYLDNKDAFIITEFKRQSPSKGIINDKVTPLTQCLTYQNHHSAAISILTDKKFFGGSIDDIIAVRNQIHIPILRKEFIKDTYQIYEAKSIGADIILLIAAICTKAEMKMYTQLAHTLGLEVIVEIHNEKELALIPADADFVGINNRNLKDFAVDIAHSSNLIGLLPKSCIPIAESGISSITQAKTLINAGFQGLLIGEYLMRAENPATTLDEILDTLKPL